MSRTLTIAGALLVFAGVFTAASGAPLKGLPLGDALRHFQDEGLALVFSSTLVRPDMRVLEEPDGQTPRERLEAILEPHGLAVREAPGGQLVVVPARRHEKRRNERPLAPAAAPIATLLGEIVVTPSRLRLLQEEPEPRHTVTADQIDRMPHLGGDAFWAVKRLPGTGGADVSARFNVRGGETDELLIVLDGLELYEPYHLKDFMSVFSTIDAAAIGTVDLLTGGFPAQYGDRMSGVMEITSAAPSSAATSTVSVGTINSYLTSSGSSDQWDWLVAARGWYPDIVLGRLEGLPEELRTDYYDIFAKLQKPAGSRSTLTIAALVAWDDLAIGESEPGELERIAAEYASQHLWANLVTDWTDRLHSRTVAGGGSVSRDRTVSKIETEEGELSVSDDRSFQFLSLKQDWTFEMSDRQLLKGGFDLRSQRAAYDYIAQSSYEGGPPQPGGDPSNRSFVVDLDPSGESYGIYVADRMKLAPSVVAEIGVRWDKQFWIEENQVSPRAQLRWDLRPRSLLRLAWGRYFQSQRLNELQVEDGVSEFFPAQMSQHWVAGFEHWLESGRRVRVEAYYKDLSRLRPRYENLFNPLELFPEAQRDRVLVRPEGARATGLEILAGSALREPVSWWASYAWAKAEDEIEGQRVPRSWDQRHTVSFGLNFTLPRSWILNLGGTWHTGWPTTALLPVLPEDPEDEEIELVAGPRNRERLPDYLRLDLRVSRSRSLGSGTLTFIGEILNLTNHRNVCCVDDVEAEILDDGTVRLLREERTWAPITPTFAVRWRI